MKVFREISIVLLCCLMTSLFFGCISSTTSSSDVVKKYEPVDYERNTDKWVMEMKFMRTQSMAPVNKLRSGDSIEVFLRGIPEEVHVQDVIDHDGYLNLPYIGRIKLAGKTSSEVELEIEDAYISGEIYNNISVIIVTPQDEYFVRGEVERPGKFVITGETTLSQAVATAGDFTDFSDKRDIIIRRNGRSYKYDMNKIDKGEQKDPFVLPGDIIVVGRRLV
ncbi:MAG: polysaccharide export protein [Kiritimatiellae bacterium]|jgi:protein involved in polysaccharide export with SLBB domain|nr:polysaccharide export protein [Kiritimatiellia bacterium]